jgi:hypothetical protein
MTTANTTTVSVLDEVKSMFNGVDFGDNKSIDSIIESGFAKVSEASKYFHGVAFHLHAVKGALYVLKSRSMISTMAKAVKLEENATLFTFEKRTKKVGKGKQAKTVSYTAVVSTDKKALSEMFSVYEVLERAVQGLLQHVAGETVDKQNSYSQIFKDLWQAKKTIQAFDLIQERLDADKADIKANAFRGAFVLARKQSFLELDVKKSATLRKMKSSFKWDEKTTNLLDKAIVNWSQAKEDASNRMKERAKAKTGTNN